MSRKRLGHYVPFRLKCLEEPIPGRQGRQGRQGDSADKSTLNQELIPADSQATGGATDWATASERARQDPVASLLRRPCRQRRFARRIGLPCSFVRKTRGPTR
jgi:hypothetical protein